MRRIRKTFFLIIDFHLSPREREKEKKNEMELRNPRSLFNCAHSVAFQNQLIIISFILRCFFFLYTFLLFFWWLPKTADLWTATMRCCYAPNDAWLLVFQISFIEHGHIVWTFLTFASINYSPSDEKFFWTKVWRRLNSFLSWAWKLKWAAVRPSCGDFCTK